MFTNEMKRELLEATKFEDAMFSLYVNDEWEREFYNIECMFKYIIDYELEVIDVYKSSITNRHEWYVETSSKMTAKEFIDAGLSFKEVNKCMKEQEVSLEEQREFLEELQDDFEAYNEKTPETSKLFAAVIEELKKVSSPFSSPAPAGCGGLALIRKPVIPARIVEPVSKDFIIANGAGIKLMTPLTDSEFNKLKENFEKNGGKIS